MNSPSTVTKLFFVSFLATGLFAQGPNFSGTINADGGGEQSYPLTFGFSPDATDGFDDGLDSYAPPAPPPPAFDAALTWGGERYYTQILSGSNDDLVEHVYDIALAYDSNNTINLSWDNTGWSDLMGSCVLQDAFGGMMINVDMLSDASASLTNPAFTGLKLMVTPLAGSEEPDTFPVTFTVTDDGNNYQDVELKGTMTDWANVDMSNDGSGTWTLTLDLEAGSYEWGAIENDGSEWGIWLPSLAGFETNPTVVVGPDGSVTGDTGFEVPCQTCSPEYSVTFQLDDSWGSVPCDGNPWLTGSMDNWSGWGAELSDGDGDGIYTVSMVLNASDVAYEYKYTCGGWDQVEDVPCDCAYNCDWQNRGFVLSDNTVLDSHPWSGCAGDEPPPAGPEFGVHLIVSSGSDEYHLMAGFSSSTTDGFDPNIDDYAPPAPPPPAFDAALGWEGDRYFIQMLGSSESDFGEAHVFDVLLQYDESGVIDLAWDNSLLNGFGTFTLSDAFGGDLLSVNMNEVEGVSVSEHTVLHFSITPGTYEPPPPSEYSVTFQLDNTWGSVPCTGNPWVTGSMDGWSGWGAELSDGDGDGIYSASMVLNASDVAYEYKYTCGGWDQVEDVPDECAYNAEWHNRGFFLNDGDLTLDSHPWSGCPGDGPPPADFPELFFSEAAEGSSNNKYLEIYNGSDEDVNLADFSLSSCSNGCDETGSFDYPNNVTFEDGTTLAAGEVYVVCHGSASDGIQAECDQTFTYLSNGDDAFALTDTTTLSILDLIGELGDDPGSGWAVAGVNNATKDNTLVRKDEVSSGNSGDWASSAGTNADDSEWVVAERPTADYTPSTLGWHIDEPAGENWGCLDPDALNYDADSDGCEDGGNDCCEYPVQPLDLSIYEIQGQADASPYVDVLVYSYGIVTGVTSSGFWMQDCDGSSGSADWCGIWVYGGADAVAIGDDVTVVGTVLEYYDLTEIELEEVNVLSSGNPLPTPVGIQTGVMEEENESVVVVATGECDNNDLGYGEWSINDGTAPGRIDDKMYAYMATVGNHYTVSGPLDYSYGAFKIQPRDENDVVDVTPEPPAGHPDFAASFSATGEGNTYNMTFGFSPDATDGFDEGIDTYAPPSPPPPAFDAALSWGGDRYYTQILNGSIDDLVEHEYDISLAFGSDGLIELSWDNTGWSDLMSGCELEDAFGGMMIWVDMLVDNSLTVDNTAFTSLKLFVTPSAGSSGPTTNPVTFTVVDDGNNYQDIELKGSMTDWANVDMNNDGSGTWTLTLDLEPGAYEWGAIENDGSEWGIWLPSLAGFDYNPVVIVGPDGDVNGDTGFTVPCQTCSPEYTVTFQLDDSWGSVPCDGNPWVTGSMDNWSGWGAELSDGDGDGMYMVSMVLNASDVAYEYKYTCGGWDQVENVPDECAYNVEWSNRGFVLSNNMILDSHPWSGCAGDGPPEIDIKTTWRLAPQAGALAVGPNPNDGSWWANSEEDVATRACLFDDEYIFNEDGTFSNVLQDETWIEGWQSGGEPEGCGAPVYPHDGSNPATYSYAFASGDGWNFGTVTLNGVGAFLGLAKAVNGGELTSPDDAPESITYDATVSDDETTMTVFINFGPGYWTFTLKTAESIDTDPCADVECGPWQECVDGECVDIPTVDITFNLDMSSVETGNSVFVGGGALFGGPADNAMSDDDGDDIWTITLTRPASTGSHHTYLNGDCGWDCKENIAGQDCADPDNWNDRFLEWGEDDVTVNACFGICGDGFCDELQPPATYDVTFQLTDDPCEGNPWVTGSMDGWSGWGAELSDEDGDGVSSVTMALIPQEAAYEYKYTCGGWDQVENVPDECAYNVEWGNRGFVLGESDMVLEQHAWSGCPGDEPPPPPAGDPDFSADIMASGEGSSYTLTFGFSPDATDGFDDGIDNYAPPAPPPPAFDAALNWAGDRYYTQILNGSADDLVEHEYGVALAFGSDGLVELSWDNAGWSDLMSSCVLQDAFGGMMINVDMLADNSLTVDNPAFTGLKLLVTPLPGSGEPDTHPVTFTVVDDGNNYQDVELKGTMTDWANVDMNNTDPASGTWTLTLDLEAGSYEWGAIENDGSEWGIWLPSLAGFDSNPTVVVGPDGSVTGDTGFTVPCQSCAPEYSVTFQLTDSQCAGNPWVTGSMDNWSGWGAELSDEDVDGVFTTSMVLYASDVAYEYKYTCGGWDIVEDVPDECAYNVEWSNRGFLLTDGDLVLDPHPWSGCPTPSSDPNFTNTITATGDDQSLTMSFGFSPDATDGYDAGIDTYAPPAPPPPAFDAALGWGGDRYYTQILNGSEDDLEEHVWDVLLQFGADGSITLEWDNSGWSDQGTFALEDAFGGMLVSVDMLADNSLYLDNPALNTLKLKVTPAVAGPPPGPITIYEIQGQAEESPYAGQEVTTVGVVTAIASNGVYIQDGSGAWNGIWVFAGEEPENVELGDLGQFTGIVEEYYGLTELVYVSAELLESGVPLPEPVVLSTAEVNDEAYEGVLVTTSGVCDESDLGYGEWSINDDSGSARIDDQMFGYEAAAGDEYVVTGPLYFSYGAYKIQPRDEGDVIDITPPPPPAPSNLTAIAGIEEVHLSWDAINDNNRDDGADFTIQVDVSGDGQTLSLVTGFSPDASDGYDAGTDTYAPPAPPPPAFDAALGWGGDRYYTQILGGDVDYSEHVVDVLLQYGTDGCVTASWDNAGWSELGSFYLRDAFGGILFEIDMTAESSAESCNPALNTLKLHMTPFEPVPPPEGTPDFTFTFNSSGGTQGGTYDLTIGLSPDATDGYDEETDSFAPPAPPPPAFDAALVWNGDRFYSQVLNGNLDDVGVEHVYEVALMYDVDNYIELSWSNAGLSAHGSFTLQDAFGGNMISVDMTVENSLVLDNPAFTSLHLVVVPGESSEPGEDTFNVYRDGALAAEGVESSSFTDAPLAGDVEYCYTVTQVFQDGSESGHSNEACATPEAAEYDLTVDVDLSAGWNWFSLNVEGDDLGVASVLESIGESGSLIKNQTSYASYYDNYGWFAEGGLENIDVESMYMISMDESATLSYTGEPVVFSDRPIGLSAGWNWVSYLPQSGNEVGAALESIGESGSLIKNQTSYASYYDNYGWFAEGGLENMMPLDGYMINMNDDATLLYTDPPGELARTIMPQLLNSPWEVNHHGYEHNMTITGVLMIDSEESMDSDDIIAAFVGEECRGIAAPIYHPVADRYTVGMMVYGHEQGENIRFGVMDASTGEIKELANAFEFEVNGAFGNGLNPVVFKTISLPVEYALSQNYPNPFNPVTNIRFELPEIADVSVSVFNARGQLIAELANKSYPAGYHFVQWNGTDSNGVPVSSGVYFYSVEAGDFHGFKKMLLVK